MLARVPIAYPDITDIIGESGLKPDMLRALLHQYHASRALQSANHKERKTDSYKNGWTPLSSAILQFLCKQYNQYIQLLEKKALLEVRRNPRTGNKSYSNGTKACLYRVPSRFLLVRGINHTYREEEVRDKKTIRALEGTARRRSRMLYKSLEPVHQTLVSFVNQARFDLEEATDYFDNNRKKYPDTREHMDYMAAFNDGLISYANVDGFGNRLHTPLSGSWKVLRCFLRFDGHKNTQLKELDVACSQPYLLSSLTPEALKLVPDTYSINDELRQMSDHKIFAFECREGKIYDYWASAMNITRAEAKESLFSTMFSWTSYIPDTDTNISRAGVFFDVTFPSVSKIIAQCKRKSYKNLPQLLQRIESAVMFKHIVPELISAGISPLLTVHDSIIVLPEHAEQTLRIMTDSYAKTLACKPPKIVLRNAGE